MSSRYRHPKTGRLILRLDGHALRMEPLHQRVDKAWTVRAWCDCGHRYRANGEYTMTKQEARLAHTLHLRLTALIEAALTTPRVETVRVREGLL